MAAEVEETIDESDTPGNQKKMKPDGLKRSEIERRLMRDCSRQQFLKESTGDSRPRGHQQNLTITPINHLEILEHITKTASQEIGNFKGLVEELGAGRISEILQEGLNPAIPSICEGGLFGSESIKDLGLHAESPVHSTKAGVYLHIRAPKSCPGRFWLYIGQSVCLKQRIYSHIRDRFTKESLPLHYSVWNSEEMESTWVGLYTHKGHPDLLPRQDRLLLNIAEMWPCCIFQTLTTHHLDKYLPGHYEKPWAGCHLNVALPLLQPFSVKEKAEAEVLRSRGSFAEYVAANPDDREWATDLTAAFHALRDGPDPVIRGYHKERLGESLKAAHNAIQQRIITSMREYLSEKEERVNVDVFMRREYSWERTWFSCGGTQIAISVVFGLNLHQGDSVFVQLHLAEAIHPYKYTTLAGPNDLARRLAISISGRDGSGEFHVWLKSPGPKAVKRMSTRYVGKACYASNCT